LPGGGFLEQADGTAWMAMYSLNMMAIALELARFDVAYEDIATKFFEHFIYIANAINGSLYGSPHGSHHGIGEMAGLWDTEAGFYYDQVHLPDGRHLPLKLNSFVGLIPLFAVETLEPDLLEKLPRFRRRMDWFIERRPWLVRDIASLTEPGAQGRLQLALVNRRRLLRVLQRMLDPQEFLSPYGLRSLSKKHEREPFSLVVNGERQTVRYEPAESRTSLFGGNSNWRGPIWFPVNYLMIESLQKYHHYYGDELQVDFPGGSGQPHNLAQIAAELSHRLTRLFLRDPETGRRPFAGGVELYQQDPHWRDYILFYEYFHGDNGAGIGASHQTGWTALVAKLIQQSSS